jgi:uncharacterized protein YdhG (YjbR/CyaY superfamily)
MANVKPAHEIDQYIVQFAPEVQGILHEIRGIVREVAPEVEEIISYRMPAFRLRGILIYVAAFKKHIGIYPPISGDAQLEESLAIYLGEKGNLRFPLDEPIPFGLIKRIVKLRVQQDRTKAEAKRKRK